MMFRLGRMTSRALTLTQQHASSSTSTVTRACYSTVVLPFNRIHAPALSNMAYRYTAQRWMSKERASKIVKPGEVIVVDDAPHKVGKITQGKRGKGGGYVR